MSRIRLRVSHRDSTLVVGQGATKRSYLPFAQCFGQGASRKAALIVKAVNCHGHLVKALEATMRTAQRPANGNSRVRLALVASYAKLALRKLES
ncbi:MAG: hypothetical protein RB191_11505 [Terriglobia bacterium]|nr:hypothetical protein [Terriglobia bacterium]